MFDRKRSNLEEKWAAQAAAEDPSGDPSEPAVHGGPLIEAAELDQLRNEVAQLRDQVLRQQAEMVNFRRRTDRDRGEVREAARGTVVRELLSVIDDFERAAAFETENLEAYRDGVQLILRSFTDAMQRVGVERLDPLLGEPFDPNLHEALERSVSDDVPPDHVVRVYSPGYRLGERLLRAATVGVAAAPAGGDPSTDSDG